MKIRYAFLLVVLILSACSPPIPYAANPASEYCQDQGGRVEIRKDSQGNETGYCIFMDGSECEEWAYLRGECGRAPLVLDTPTSAVEVQEAIQVLPQSTGRANPALLRCGEQGGKFEMRTAPDGSQQGFCVYTDGSECEQNAMLRGECGPAVAYHPLDAESCSSLAMQVQQALGIPPTNEIAPFQVPFTGEGGQACELVVSGNGTQFAGPIPVLDALKAVLEGLGWQEDIEYMASGPTGQATGMRLEAGLCLLSVDWKPSAEANCPSDQPITACNLAPEQKLYEILVACATKGP